MDYKANLADFAVRSAISVAPGRVWGAMANTESGRIVVRMAELLMNSATIESGAYVDPRTAPLLDALAVRLAAVALDRMRSGVSPVVCP